jgi:hypothetical protein
MQTTQVTLACSALPPKKLEDHAQPQTMAVVAENLADKQQCCIVQDTLDSRTNAAPRLIVLKCQSFLSYALHATSRPRLTRP